MRILNERQASDEETLIFGITVINKTLNGVPDQVNKRIQTKMQFQDTFFDIIDSLEAQGLEESLKAMVKLNNSQLTQQCNHYEQELRKEDAALESDTNESVLVKMRYKIIKIKLKLGVASLVFYHKTFQHKRKKKCMFKPKSGPTL